MKNTEYYVFFAYGLLAHAVVAKPAVDLIGEDGELYHLVIFSVLPK